MGHPFTFDIPGHAVSAGIKTFECRFDGGAKIALVAELMLSRCVPGGIDGGLSFWFPWGSSLSLRCARAVSHRQDRR